MSVIAAPPRVFTRDDGRERIGIGFWNGVLTTPAALAIGFVAAVIAAIALLVAVRRITGHLPSTNAGHPLAAMIGLVFRGLLFGALAPRLGVLGGAFITALLFGAAHGDLILFPTLAALGFVAALAYAATGNLTVAIALHAINNSLGAAALVGMSLRHHA